LKLLYRDEHAHRLELVDGLSGKLRSQRRNEGVDVPLRVEEMGRHTVPIEPVPGDDLELERTIAAIPGARDGWARKPKLDAANLSGRRKPRNPA
jgi:hypothetical protein